MLNSAMESETYLTPSRLAELASALYTSTKGLNSYTVAFHSQYGWALFWSCFLVFGAFGTVSAFMAIIDLRDNVSEPLLVLGMSAFFMLCGAWLLSRSIDWRTITVSPGRATITWRLFGWPIRKSSFDVRLVVVQHDLWKRGHGSTDSIVLKGEQTHSVTTLWNAWRIGSFKPPLNTMPVGPASENLPVKGSMNERTVSPMIIGLAASLAIAACAPIILRVGKTRWPSITMGGD